MCRSRFRRQPSRPREPSTADSWDFPKSRSPKPYGGEVVFWLQVGDRQVHVGTEEEPPLPAGSFGRIRRLAGPSSKCPFKLPFEEASTAHLFGGLAPQKGWLRSLKHRDYERSYPDFVSHRRRQRPGRRA